MFLKAFPPASHSNPQCDAAQCLLLGRLLLKKVPNLSSSCYTLLGYFSLPYTMLQGWRKGPCRKKFITKRPWHSNSRVSQGKM